MRSIKNETNLRDKKILLRLDLNVPIIKGKISDTTRICLLYTSDAADE